MSYLYSPEFCLSRVRWKSHARFWGGGENSNVIPATRLIDGETIDAELFNALYVSQVNFEYFFEACEDWDDDQKTKVIIAVGECGYEFDLAKDTPDQFDIDIYEFDTMRDLAIHYVDEGLFGEIPENLQFYLDYDAIARDLAVEYTQTVINGQRLIYRCS